MLWVWFFFFGFFENGGGFGFVGGRAVRAVWFVRGEGRGERAYLPGRVDFMA